MPDGDVSLDVGISEILGRCAQMDDRIDEFLVAAGTVESMNGQPFVAGVVAHPPEGVVIVSPRVGWCVVRVPHDGSVMGVANGVHKGLPVPDPEFFDRHFDGAPRAVVEVLPACLVPESDLVPVRYIRSGIGESPGDIAVETDDDTRTSR